MIGAIIAKKKTRSVFDSLSRHDLDAFLAGWAGDATRIYPSPTGPSFHDVIPEIKGKEAIREWYQKFIEEFPVTSFTVKNIFVRNIFALGGTNVIAVEWELDLTNRGGQEHHTSGVTVITLKKGKATEVREYECEGHPIWRAIGPKKDKA